MSANGEGLGGQEIKKSRNQEVEKFEDLVDLVSNQLDHLDPGQALLIVGPGGIGKTEIFWDSRNARERFEGEIYVDAEAQGDTLNLLKRKLHDLSEEMRPSSRNFIVIDEVNVLPLRSLAEIRTYSLESGFPLALMGRPHDRIIGQILRKGDVFIEICVGECVTGFVNDDVTSIKVHIKKGYFREALESFLETLRVPMNTRRLVLLEFSKLSIKDIMDRARNSNSVMMGLKDFIFEQWD